MNTNEALEKQDLNSTQRSLAQSLIMTGATLEDALETVKGYSGGLNKKKSRSPFECPKCGITMKTVSLMDDRKAVYCSNDRICLPI